MNSLRRKLVTPSQSEKSASEEERRKLAYESLRTARRKERSSWRGSPTGLNTGDALVTLARDTVHSHWNVVAELADIFCLGSVGEILRHDATTFRRRPYVRASTVRAGTVFGNILSKYVPSLTTASPDAVRETASAFVLEFKVPGWTKEQLTIHAGQNWVRVHGEKPEEEEPDILEPAEQPRVVTYDARWTAPEEINPEDVTANLENGILRVTVGKLEENRARTVPIN
jgi:HSP20 family molecular chaperone IbpA